MLKKIMKTYKKFIAEAGATVANDAEMKYAFSRKKVKKQKKDVDSALKDKEEIDTEPSIGSEIPGNTFT